MIIRAIILDVYGTLLQIGPPPADASERWRSLWQKILGCEPRLSHLDFSLACNRIIAQRHGMARARGIAWPEVYWPSVVSEVVSDLEHLPQSERDEFIFCQIQTVHTTRMTSETADTLRWLKQHPFTLGIASNSQAYTRRELQEAFTAHAFATSPFDQDLCFWSYEHGFSKPDPHVFQILAARLEARDIRARETLMVGDRLDNDIEPARGQGWQTWQLVSTKQNGPSGNWRDMLASLEQAK